MTARVTLFSSAGTGSPSSCRVTFSADLPAGDYQMCVESFATATPVTAAYAVSASGIFSMPTWDNAAGGERVNLVVAPSSVQTTSVGFRLGPNLKSQTLSIVVRDALGATITGFPAWIMQCIILPVP